MRHVLASRGSNFDASCIGIERIEFRHVNSSCCLLDATRSTQSWPALIKGDQRRCSASISDVFV